MRTRTNVGGALLRGAAVAALAIATCAVAGELHGVKMADTVTTAGHDLKLNGMGLRTATALHVKVYVVGLYLEESSSDAEAIIESRGAKRFVMHFMRHVTAKELRETWEEDFESTGDVKAIQPQIDQLLKSLSDVKKKDEIQLDFTDDQVEVSLDGKVLTTIKGEAFQAALISTWIGPKSTYEDLKNGLLGKE